MTRQFYLLFIKSFFDRISATIALVILLPVFLILILLLWTTGHRKIFFLQKRVGLRGNIFTLIKFISMTQQKDSNGILLPDADRLTRFGKFLRKSSLDELPQLLNVIKGDMSIVGPRPLLPEYLLLYSPEQKKRHDMKPGITGWAQINGRNAITWNEKFTLDVWYVTHVNLFLDIKIIFTTILRLLRPTNIHQVGMATTEPFNGTN